MTVARQLAERILVVDYDALPADAVHWAKLGILDTVAVTLAGAAEPCTQIAAHLPGVAESDGPALLFGMGRRTSVLDAAFVNGIASHALDYDDVNNQIGGHPSVPLVPALFAVADMAGPVSGKDAVAAYVAGFETATQVGLGVNFHHYAKGWHPTATLGIFGTVAVAARVLGLDVDQTTTALGLATSLSSGVKANFGTMTKPLHIGHSLRCGVMAALMVRDGFTANAGAFEHKQGFFEVFNGAGAYDADRIFVGWGDPWNVASPGPSLKAYPCCGSTHGAIDGALALRAQQGIAADSIATVRMLTDPKRLPHTDNPDPQTGLAAKFSVQYVTARALIDGAVKLEHFENDAYTDPAVRDLMAKVETGVHPDMQAPGSDTYAAEVTVTTTGGETFSYRSPDAVLRGPSRPMSDEELFGKFSDCAARALDDGHIRPLFETLMGLEALDDLATVSALASGSGCGAARATE